jgi:hypothetical protein
MPVDEETAPGLGEQFRRTRAAFSRLLSAHFALLRAELAAIGDLLKQIATLAAAILAFALLVASMLYVGGFLFLGEWAFGSLGWGLAHGVLFGLGVMVALMLAILGASGARALSAFLIALVVTIVIALLLGYNVLFETANYFAQQLAAPLNTPATVALLAGAVLLGVLMMVIFGRLFGVGGAVFGLVLGGLLGLFLGWIMGGISWTLPPAAGFAITIGLLLWPVVQVALAWPTIDLEARFGQLVPRQTIDSATETKEWLEEQWRTRRPTLGRK